MKARLPALLLAVVLLGIHLALGFGFIRSAAPTYDEPVHLASGYSYLKTGRYRLNIMDHPPLAEMWAAAPLLALGPRLLLQHPDWVAGRAYHYADRFLYRNRVDADRMLGAARRFAFVTWTALLAGAVLAWGALAAGPAALAGAAAAYAFCPALSSNLALVTTDGGATAFFFLTCFLLYLAGRLVSGIRSFMLWGLAGACFGLANAAKFSMIVLGPIALATAVADWRMRPRPRPRAPGPQAAVFLAVGLLMLAAVYRFGQFPLYWEGLRATLERLGEGRSTFFLGRHSTTGFALYFPAALSVKTPLALWALAALGAWALPRREKPWALLPPLLYLAAALTAKVQIGFRHVLPVVPFLILWAGVGAAWLWSRARRGLCRGALAVLLCWQAVSVVLVHPHHLAYFNELAGGPSGGWRWLVDSNLDWGQELGALARELQGLGSPPVYLSYFGTADPSYYGIRYVPVAMPGHVEREGDALDPSASGRVLLAVSATNLQCAYFADKTLFDWLKARTPLARVGHAVFLYDLTGDGQAYQRLARLLAMSGRPGAARTLLRSRPASGKPAATEARRASALNS